ncbi:ribosomal protection-like ABC-F family protein [Myxacorys almedinensis]|uniref:ATP-binding cassette domain-containing protein n=1 Tax=Myxacorys almedinensis A TaxID=2690445 RepID=A0A8J8CI26_9CYAN|nr:ABC-F family ATP-binding cassette domain-containing protein [Myxacorys almedinensis]NDJ17299.1 ATP-binding cassette domain-containing protein [Myxacorys almedinensis A]
MSVLTVQSIKKDFGIKEVVRDASFSLEAGEKVGLIGTNGSGKSTLLKMIAGLEPLDSGQIVSPSGSQIVYLPQQPDLDENLTVLEQVFADGGEQMTLVKEYEHLTEQLAQAEGDMDALMARFSRVTARMDAIAAWDVETQAKIILTKLGIENLDATIGQLSGGYRKRIALATALLAEPDVLLMDEPTNHLDALSIEWLQSYLARYRGALLLVTHDRYFLDRVTHRIIELDRGDLFTYSGNYSYYLEKKADAEASAASTQRKHQGVLRRELEWLKRGPKARSTKQKARIDRVHEMQDTEFKQAQGKVEIATAGRRIGKKVIELHHISKSYPHPSRTGANRTLIKDFTYLFNPEDRIGIIGGNGAGKSTLMDLITQRVQPDAGRIEIGSTIHIGYFDQHSDELQDSLNENQRVIDYLKSVAELVKTSDGEVITASQMLERFLFPPNQQYAPIHKLSGGEKRRLFLLRVLMSAPNVLILDEPTNDLDVQTLAVLEEYLEDFNGCVIAVSHDRYFLDRTVDRIFALEPGGNLRQYPGNYSVYLDYKTAEEATEKASELAKQSRKAEPRSQQNASSKAPPAANLIHQTSANHKPRKLTFKEKRELETLEAQIPQMEEEKSKVEYTLYNNPPEGFTELQSLSEKLAMLSEQIDTSTERWLELSEIDA